MNQFNGVKISFALLFGFIYVTQAVAQIAFVKTIGTTALSSKSSSTAIAVPAAGVAAGNSIILSLALNPSTGAVSCGDTRGNGYTANLDVSNGSGNSGVRIVVLSAHNVNALSSGQTISCAHPSVAARALAANEFFGLAATSTLDAVASSTGNSKSPSSGNTSSTIQASELLIGAIGVEGPASETFTAGASYTTIGRAGTSGGNAANNITINPSYRGVNATGGYAATGTLSSTRRWAASIATFKAAAPVATKLVITSVNGGGNPTAGIYFPVVVQSQDMSGTPANVVSATVVNLSLKTGTGTLGGTLTGTIAAGASQVTITGVTYTTAESVVAITAARGSGDNLSAGDSAPFAVEPGAANKILFTAQPGSSTAGVALSGSPSVVVQDSLGNTVTSYSAAISVAIGTNPAGGTLSGTISKIASGGVASFNDLSIDKAGTGYTLTASSSGLISATSSAFDISATAASKLVFITQPTSAIAGSTIGGPPSVAVQDVFGNTVTSSTALITLAIGSNPSGATLSGTVTVPASSGVATFNSLSLNKSATGYTLTASAANVTGATSSAFNISAGSAAALIFTTQPGNTIAGTSISGPPAVAVRDGFGNTVTSSSASITIGIGANPGGGTLSGTTTKNAASGVASFGDLSINQAGAGYTLTAAATGLSGTTSGTFSITAGSGVSLTASPTSLTVGNPFTVTWAQISNPSGWDWFGLYTPGSDDNLYIDYRYVSCTYSPSVPVGSGSCSFPIPTNRPPGTYEFRLFTNNSYNRIATSNSVTVNAAATLFASPASTVAGATVTVTWSQIPNPTNTDWIRLHGISNGVFGASIYVNCTQTPTVAVASGSCPYELPSSLAPGQYEFRLFTNDTNTVIATSSLVTVVAPSKLAVYINQTVTAGTPGFSLTAESQTASGSRANVSSDTALTISLKTGTGMLSGILNGTILAGRSQVTIGLATYSKAESNVVLTVARTSGDILTAGDTLPFTVYPGPASKLAFTTQPANTTVGSTIPGPPTVTVQDNEGNSVTSSTAAITVALGTNPSNGTLSGNMTVTTGSSIAFTGLSINQPGNSYTLTASATGLVSATSNPFDITSAGGGGTIGGVITRVSNGGTIAGALVEAYQGTALRGTAFSNATGNYSISGLAAGSYIVRATFAGLVPQMVNNVSVVDGLTTTVPISLNFGIAVYAPIAGATINDFSVLVTGFIDTSLAPEVGITVNGYVALIDGDEFAALVPIDSQTALLTATLKDTAGNFIAADAVPVSPQLPTGASALFFRPSPVIALVSQPVGFTLTSVNSFTQLQLDGNGDGTIDYNGNTLQGVQVTFAESGLYFPTVTLTEQDGTVRTASTLVQVFDATQLDTLLQNKWTAMKNALRQGDVSAAASHIVMRRRATYAAMFNALSVPLANIDQVLTSITLLEQRGIEAEYEMLVNEAGTQHSYMVLFAIDEDGVWRVKFF